MERQTADIRTVITPPPLPAEGRPILTVAELLAALAASRAAGDASMSRSLVDLGSQWAMDADLDMEFAHQGIYWDAAGDDELADADAVAARAKADLVHFLTDTAIEAQYQHELQGQHYQAMRAERLPSPSLSDDDEYA